MRRLFLGIVMAVVLAACGAVGPGGATSNDPVGAVNKVVQLVQAKQFTQMASAVCAARQAEVVEQFDLSRTFTESVPGVDAQAVLDAMTINITDLQVTEVSRTGNTAVVAITGTMSFGFDQARMRELLAPALEQQGLPASMLDTMLTQMATQTVPIDSQLEVVNENGVWLVCDSLD